MLEEDCLLLLLRATEEEETVLTEDEEAIFWLLDEEEEDVFADEELVLPASPFLLLLETFFADKELYGSPSLRFEDDWSRKTFRLCNKFSHSILLSFHIPNIKYLKPPQKVLRPQAPEPV